MSFYAAQIIGLKDMRSLRGPFQAIDEALRCAFAINESRESCGDRVDPVRQGYWYSIHGENGDLCFVDGPYKDAEKAEAKRLRNLVEYDIECAGDEGHIGRVERVIGTAIVLSVEK